MDGYVTIGTELDTKSFDNQIQQVESELRTLEKRYEETKNMQPFKGQEDDLKDIALQIEKVNNKLVGLKERQADLRTNDLPKIGNHFEDIGKSVEGITKKVVKWGLAIFGIRSAYNLIRSSINTILAQDSQLSADVEYMRNVIAYTLEPVIRRIIDLMKTLLSYVAYIVKAWTGRDIFANANKSLKQANKSAKDLGKTLSGFDEVNIIGQDTSSGGGGGATPNVPSIGEGEAPEWLKWIADNGETVLDILFGLSGALIAVKLGLTGIQALGVGLAIAGILMTIQNIIKFLKDPTFDNFIGILKGIAIAAIGVGLAIGAWPLAIAGAVIGAIALILKYYDKIIGFFDNIENWLETVFYSALEKLFGTEIANAIMTPIRYALGFAKGLFEGFWGGIKTVVNGIVKLFKGDLKGGIESVFKGLKSIMLAPINAFITGINAVIKGLNKIKIPDWVPVLGGKGINIPQIPKLAKGAIANVPGSGIPTPSGGANWAEAGREAYLPLTDQQVMAELGQEIAKNIVINANITNTMNGRVISRELQRVQNDNNFAFNR